MDNIDLDRATLNDLAKNLRKAIQKTFSNTKADRKILDSIKNSLDISSNNILKEVNSIIELLTSAKSDSSLANVISAYESHLHGLTLEDFQSISAALASSTDQLHTKEASFDTQRKRTTEFIKSILPNIATDKLTALTKVLQLGHSSGVYSFKLVDELRILGRVGQVQTSKSGTSLAASIEKFKRAEFLISRLVDTSKVQDLINTFGYDITNSNQLAKLLEDIFSGTISESQVYDKIKQLDADSSIKSKTVNDYIEYIQFGDKFQLFSTLEKNATKNNVSVSLTIENALDNIIKGNVISALSRAGNTVMLANIQKYMSTADYAKFKQEFSKVAFADKEIVSVLTKLVSSKTFKQLVVERIVNPVLNIPTNDYKQSKPLAIDIPVAKTKIKVDNSKIINAQKRLKTVLSEQTTTTPKLRNLQGQFTSLTKLETLIRSLLLETIQKNMQRPNLRNQTGRFAESVKLDRLQRERDGSLTAFLSYMKYPYATFEKGGRQGFRGYYPSRLLDQSAREIATKLVTARLKTVIV